MSSLFVLFVIVAVATSVNPAIASWFNGNTSYQYQAQTLNCTEGEGCTVDCLHTRACAGATINCPTDGPCNVNCDSSDESCSSATINCPTNASCNVHCGDSGGINWPTGSCSHATFNWADTPGLGSLACDGYNACRNINEWPTPDPDTPTIVDCVHDYACAETTIICPTDASCTVNCVDSYERPCRGVTVNCPTNGPCDVNCDSYEACIGAIINCPTNASCNVNCRSTDGCSGATFNWADTPGLGSLVCAGDGACRDINEWPTPDPDTPTNITCEVQFSCESTNNMKCPSNAACVVECIGDQTCNNINNIQCPLTAPCTVKCVAAQACGGTQITWSTTPGLGKLVCREWDSEACGGVNLPPGTSAPTIATSAPTTASPTSATSSPTTAAPTTAAPTTAPTTSSPTTAAPTTPVPTTAAPTTDVPTTDAPTTAPSSQPTPLQTTTSPTTDPTTDAPTTFASTNQPTVSPLTTTAITVYNVAVTIHTDSLSSEEILIAVAYAFNLSSTRFIVTSVSSNDDDDDEFWTTVKLLVAVASDTSLEYDVIEATLREAMVKEYGDDINVDITVEGDDHDRPPSEQTALWSWLLPVGVCIASVCVCCCGAVAVVYLSRRRKRMRRSLYPGQQPPPIPPQPQAQPQPQSAEEIEIPGLVKVLSQSATQVVVCDNDDEQKQGEEDVELELEMVRKEENEKFVFDGNKNYKREGSRASIVTPGVNQGVAVEDVADRKSDSEELYVVNNGNATADAASPSTNSDSSEEMYVVNEQPTSVTQAAIPTAGTTAGVDPDLEVYELNNTVNL